MPRSLTPPACSMSHRRPEPGISSSQKASSTAGACCPAFLFIPGRQDMICHIGLANLKGMPYKPLRYRETQAKIWFSWCFSRFYLMFSQSGCTYMLWSDQNYESFHQPAPISDLHLYQSKKQNDVLVVYREQSERNEHVCTRAYWLNRNQIRVTRPSPPIFINKKAARNLPAVPILI